MTAKETGIGSQSKGNVNGAHHQGERGLRRRQIQAVNAGDLLKALRGGGVWPLGLNRLAVGEDIQAQRLGAEGEIDVLCDRQFDEQRERTVVGRQLEMNPEPGKKLPVLAGKLGPGRA